MVIRKSKPTQKEVSPSNLRLAINLIKAQVPNEWDEVLSYIQDRGRMPVMSHQMPASEIAAVAMQKQGINDIYEFLIKES